MKSNISRAFVFLRADAVMTQPHRYFPAKKTILVKMCYHLTMLINKGLLKLFNIHFQTYTISCIVNFISVMVKVITFLITPSKNFRL